MLLGQYITLDDFEAKDTCISQDYWRIAAMA
jgi:hypothetical protein